MSTASMDSKNYLRSQEISSIENRAVTTCPGLVLEIMVKKWVMVYGGNLSNPYKLSGENLL